MENEYKNEKVFRFQDDDFKGLISYDLRLFKRMGKAFEYVYEKLEKLGYHITDGVLDQDKFIEGKSYHWTSFKDGDVRMLLRQYGEHYTIFTCLDEEEKIGDHSYFEHTYSALTFNTNTRGIKEEDIREEDRKEFQKWKDDFFYCMPFYELNHHLPALIKMIREDKLHGLWNNLMFVRPDHVEVKQIFEGRSIKSFDLLIFAAEELSQKHMELFAENDMLEKLKTLKVGDAFGKGKILEISTEVPNDYYHAVGLKVEEEGGREKWEDIYSLTHWYIDKIYPDAKPSC